MLRYEANQTDLWIKSQWFTVVNSIINYKTYVGKGPG